MYIIYLFYLDDQLDDAGSGIVLEKNAVVQHGDQFSDYLRKGLADNWSQVGKLNVIVDHFKGITKTIHSLSYIL